MYIGQRQPASARPSSVLLQSEDYDFKTDLIVASFGVADYESHLPEAGFG